jgi:hypothetical protein
MSNTKGTLHIRHDAEKLIAFAKAAEDCGLNASTVVRILVDAWMQDPTIANLADKQPGKQVVVKPAGRPAKAERTPEEVYAANAPVVAEYISTKLQEPGMPTDPDGIRAVIRDEVQHHTIGFTELEADEFVYWYMLHHSVPT